jgi:hypothetical protein
MTLQCNTATPPHPALDVARGVLAEVAARHRPARSINCDPSPLPHDRSPSQRGRWRRSRRTHLPVLGRCNDMRRSSHYQFGADYHTPTVTRQDPRERVTCCVRDGAAQDRDRDVGDHRRSREHPAAEGGERNQPAPSRPPPPLLPVRVAMGRLPMRRCDYIGLSRGASGWNLGGVTPGPLPLCRREEIAIRWSRLTLPRRAFFSHRTSLPSLWRRS